MAEEQSFQVRVRNWMRHCFGTAISQDRAERNFRFMEEAIELVQACGATREEVLELVDYVYSRPAGQKSQEVGGVMVTLAALCDAHGISLKNSAETELARIWTCVDKIRAKQEAKPEGIRTPLPGVVDGPG